ncbi:MAG: methyltransferase domain-containing protein [Bryobacteraceae bacterium]
MSEFTGERVIPGQVEDDLWAEHIARYAFATRFVDGKRVLDLGCGTGYGTAELAKYAFEAVGVDISREAIDYAKAHYRTARYVEVPATELPFEPATFDAVVSFELIEHLSDWRPLLAQVKRVLHPGGLFIVSTPNKLYYAEARGAAGPNPFHEHEFEHAEFAAAMREFFPHVKLVLQDRTEAFVFYDASESGASQIERASDDPTTANFFIAICSEEPLEPIAPFVYVPAAVNLLRERERHIAKLEEELFQVRQWLDQTTASRNLIMQEHASIQREADEKTRWAKELEGLLQSAQSRVVELQDQNATQQAEATAIIENLHAENHKNIGWAQETGRALTQKSEELANTVKLLDQAEQTVVERTRWAQGLNSELEAERARIEAIRQSRWMKLGRGAGLGPKLDS